MKNEHTTWNKDSLRYHQLGDLLQVIAEDQCGTIIDDATHQRWREMMGLMTEIDSYVDERIVTGTGSYPQLIRELQEYDRFRESYPHLAPEQMGAVVFEETMQTALRLLLAFESLRQAQDFDTYASFRRQEAEATAELFAACATDATRKQENFHSVFLPMLKKFGVSGCMIDSAKDLSADYNEGISALVPRPRHRLNLLKIAFTEICTEVGVVRSNRVRKELAKAAIIHAGRRLRKTL